MFDKQIVFRFWPSPEIHVYK